MKKLAAVVLLAVMLTGCFSAKSELDRAMALRTKLLSAKGCSFEAEVTADYGDMLYSFGALCRSGEKGALEFELTSPESIAGICGRIANAKGEITFDDVAVAFPLMADGLLSPASGPWIFLKTLRGGYITAAGSEGELLHLNINDSYRDDALELDIWLDGEDNPVRAEICSEGRRYLSMNIKDFRME